MKKILFVVMMMALASAAFAKQVVLDGGDSIIVTDDNWCLLTLDSFSDARKVEYIREQMPKKLGGKKLVYQYDKIVKSNDLAEKYNQLYVFSKNNTTMAFINNLGDGRMIVIFYTGE